MDSRKLLRIVLVAFVAQAVGGDIFSDERGSLLQLRDTLSSAADLHSNWTGPPCHYDRSRWFGITCSNSTVIGIALEGIQLTGTLRPDAFQNVTYLTNLTLSDNALHGDLPSLKGLSNLRVVSFSGNRFSGSIPMDFAKLPELSRLELQDNLLNGTIPLFNQQSLMALNVSHNFLRGSIPATGVMQRFSGSSYDHNLELCGKPLNKPCAMYSSPPTSIFRGRSSPTSLSPPKPSSKKPLQLWSILLIALAVLMVPLTVALYFLFYNKRSTKKWEITNRYSRVEASAGKMELTRKARVPESDVGMEIDDGALEFFDEGKVVFDMNDLLRSPAEVMGKGRSGFSYKVNVAESGPVVAVKRMRDASQLSEKEFVQQMREIGRMKHENLVDMISFYCSNDEKLIIYEYIPGGCLFRLLHGNRGEGRVPLNWASRLSIIKGVAKGLDFLHQSLPTYKLPHGNLKSSNVLLHQRHPYYQPKLTDYGFFPLLPSQLHGRKLAAGKSPEFRQGKKLTHKADVFCFGLLLLEVITGQAPATGERDLSGWARSVVSGHGSTEILDEELVAEKEGHWEMFKLSEIALECTSTDAERRPRMSEVVEMIQYIEVVRNEERTD